ncbi:MAG: HAMP domain-containing sensor histidine kinase [bacterium]|nr:HAMP domain-containing sensor histidine kinase [bacterium]MDY4980029.1 HAMP domain-containing sensor histidine kinase [Candidatus Onthovivens sp.]
MKANQKVDTLEKVSFITLFISFILSILLSFLVLYKSTSTFNYKIKQDNEVDYVSYSVNTIEPTRFNLINYVDYVPNKFTDVKDIRKGKGYNISNGLSEYGTIYIGIEEFNYESEIDYEVIYNKFKNYADGLNNVKFGLYIPHVFDVYYVYLNDNLIRTNGSFAKYDAINKDFSQCEAKVISKEFKSNTIPLNINLPPYSARSIPHTNIFTIHYKINPNVNLKNLSFMFGTYDKIASYSFYNQLQLILTLTFSLCSISSLILFIVLSKKAPTNFILISLGVILVIYVISIFFINYDSSTIPIFWFYLIVISLDLIPLSLPCFRLNKIKTLNFILLALNLAFIITDITLFSLHLETYVLFKAIYLGLILIEIIYSSILIMHTKKTPDIFMIFASLMPIISFISAFNYGFLLAPSFIYVLTFALISVGVIYHNLILNAKRYKLTNAKVIDVGNVIDNSDDIQKVLRVLFHDLKNELILERNSLELLKANSNELEKETLIEGLIKHNESQLNIIKEGSSFSKENFTPTILESVNIQDILLNIYDELKEDAYALGIELKINKIKEGMVISNKFVLDSSIKNILFNALEHSNCKTIRIKTSVSPYYYIIKIIDDGKGISDPEHIFNPYKEEKNNNEGLGLYLIKSQLNNANGHIELKRRKVGTEFKIYLLLDSNY